MITPSPSGLGPRPHFSVAKVATITIPLVLVVLAVGAYAYWKNRPDPRPVKLNHFLEKGLVVPTKLDDGLVDEDGDLVADPPKDAKELIDPASLVFTLLGSELGREQEIWGEFAVHLGKVTGKKVELAIAPNSTRELMTSLREGRVQLVALSTGAVSTAVNRGGVVPFCVMADDAGKFGYQMEIIVPAASPIKKPEDLKGKAISFVSYDSHSGFKAPVVILWKQFGLQAGRDYKALIEGNQEMVTKGVAKDRLQAGPVAGDLLKRIIARGDIDAKNIRSIYKSETFPPACFAYVHQLKPELAKSIQMAFLDYRWENTTLHKAYAAAGQTRFVPISYKKDWAAVRAMEGYAVELLASASDAKK
jgi:phosphonate transport system substrate-binding protein